MRLNFSDVEVKDFDPIPKGTYVVNITDYEIKEAGPSAKNPGSEYINWEFTVQEGEYTNRRLWTNTSLLQQSIWVLKGLLAATGKYSSEQLELDEFEFEPSDVLGATLKVDVTVKPAQGDYEAQNNIKKFRRYDDAASDSSLLP